MGGRRGERTILGPEPEDSDERHGVEDRDAEGREVVEGPVRRLRELRGDQRANKRARACL